jgi:sporulation protein YlmC with PRC-barrel domain
MKIENGKKLIAAAIMATFGAALSLPAQSQSQSQSQSQDKTGAPAARSSTGASTSRDMRASKLIGMDVKNAKGDKLGKIDDVMVDIDNELAAYVVLSAGGALGVGNRMVAVPAASFKVGNEKDGVILNATADQLKKAPEYDEKKQANFSRDSYRSEVDRYFFKEETVRHAPSGAKLMSAKTLIGKDINDRAAHDAGEIEDLVLNLGNAGSYVVMEVDKSWSPGDKLVAVPFSAFTYPSRPDLDLLLNIDRKVLENAKGFTDNKWPDLGSTAAQQQVRQELASMQSAVKSSPGETQTGRETAASGNIPGTQPSGPSSGGPGNATGGSSSSGGAGGSAGANAGSSAGTSSGAAPASGTPSGSSAR